MEIQLKTWGSQKDKEAVILIVNACSSRDVTENVVGVCFVGQDVTGQKMVLDKFTRIQGDYKAIVQNPNPLIPPIFGSDEYGYCSEWNPSMEKLTGWKREEVSPLSVSLYNPLTSVATVTCATPMSPDIVEVIREIANKKSGSISLLYGQYGIQIVFRLT